MNLFIVLIGIIAIVLGSVMLYRCKDVEEDELVEKGPGVHEEPWYISLKAVIALILGLFVSLAGVAT